VIHAVEGMIETILTLSAQEVAEPGRPGQTSGEIRWCGSLDGRVALADLQVLRVKSATSLHGER